MIFIQGFCIQFLSSLVEEMYCFFSITWSVVFDFFLKILVFACKTALTTKWNKNCQIWMKPKKGEISSKNNKMTEKCEINSRLILYLRHTMCLIIEIKTSVCKSIYYRLITVIHFVLPILLLSLKITKILKKKCESPSFCVKPFNFQLVCNSAIALDIFTNLIFFKVNFQ
jgi:hypothetical protein